MNSSFRADIENLKKLAYHRDQWSEELLRKVHRLPKKCRSHPDSRYLQLIRRWLMAPVTLWPIDINGLGLVVVEKLQRGEPLDASLRFMMKLLDEPPGQSVQELVARHEHQVQVGEYESLLLAAHKYRFQEKSLLANSSFVKEWDALKTQFDVEKFKDHKGVIRRRLVQERNLRAVFGFRWKNRTEQFREIFDAFCHRWNLYGMQGDMPLLLRLSVNLTPYGTMIFIPAYWSLDYKRDFKWKAIAALHRARGVPRQGEKLGMNRISREDEARKAASLWAAASKAGLKGDRKTNWVMEQMKWLPGTDESKLKRLLRLHAARR
ncbi:MAG: hypothetical protein PHV34_14755 [Verrucomicrobiae bacterium]|nr:hypothetical protein [Verrucomicrobiae bacterium]